MILTTTPTLDTRLKAWSTANKLPPEIFINDALDVLLKIGKTILTLSRFALKSTLDA